MSTATAIPELIPQAYTVLSIGALTVGLLALILAGLALRRGGRLATHYQSLMQGAEGEDLAAALEAFAGRLSKAEGRLQAVEGATADLGERWRRLAEAEAALAALQAEAVDLDRRLRGALQHVKLLRFTAFADVGGDQSFALALLDDLGAGVVVSGLHSRNGVRVYAKPLLDRRSTYALTTEEERAIAEAVSGGANG